MSKNGYLKTVEVMHLLRVSNVTLAEWVRAGRLSSKPGKGRARLFRREDVLELQRYEESLLSAAEVAQLLGVCENTVQLEARKGVLRAQRGGNGSPYRFERSGVVAYWRGEMRGACLRCGILGEAEPELGFMCEPCEYEHRTGRIYPWPREPRRKVSAWPRGSLAIDLSGGNGDSSYS